MHPPSLPSGLARRPLLPLIAAQFFDAAGGRFSSLILALWSVKTAGLQGFSGFASAGLLGTAAAALLIGPLSTRLPARSIMRSAVSGLVLARLASYGSLVLGLGLGPLFATTFFGAICGTVMVNAAKTYVPHDPDRAPANFAWLGLSGSVGGAIGAAAAGVLTTVAPRWLLAGLGLMAATGSLSPMLRLSARAAIPPAPAPKGEVRQALVRARSPIVLTVVIGSWAGALGLLRDGVVAELYSSRWIGLVTLASLAGGLASTGAVSRLSRHSGSHHDLAVWSGLAALATVGWAVVDRGIVWLLLAQVVAGWSGSARIALADGRLLQAVGVEHLPTVSSVRDALSAVLGAVALGVSPFLLDRLGYGRASLVLVVPLVAACAYGLSMSRDVNSPPATRSSLGWDGVGRGRWGIRSRGVVR